MRAEVVNYCSSDQVPSWHLPIQLPPPRECNDAHFKIKHLAMRAALRVSLRASLPFHVTWSDSDCLWLRRAIPQGRADGYRRSRRTCSEEQRQVSSPRADPGR